MRKQGLVEPDSIYEETGTLIQPDSYASKQEAYFKLDDSCMMKKELTRALYIYSSMNKQIYNLYNNNISFNPYGRQLLT